MNQKLVALFAAVAATSALVSGCGGGGGSPSLSPSPPPPAPTPVPPPPPGTARGTLMGTANASTISQSTIDNFGNNGSKGPFLAGETASCAVSILQIRYATVDYYSGDLQTASAGLLVPSGSNACTKNRPLLTFQHGTSDSVSFDGSSPSAQLPLTVAKYFASHGYVTVVPDYLGYGTTAGHFHPYVVAEADAAPVIDAVRAARQWVAANPGVVSLNSQLFLSGTSEGGFVTMATHRTMERDFPSEFQITADVPVSGPYDLGTEVMNDLELADASGNSASGSSTFLLTAYQAVYGDLWSATSDVFQAPWSDTVVGLYPGVYGSDSQAIQACKIPYALDTANGKLASGCSSNAALLQPQFVTDYEAGTPGTDGGRARAHVDANGLLQGWSATNHGKNLAPMTVCYGDQDPVAALNATSAASFFGITAMNVQTSAAPFITNWVVANSTGSSALEYHGAVEAPACTAFARYQVFDGYVGSGNVP